MLIAGIITGLVLLRRAKRKGYVLGKKGKLVERIECAEKREESAASSGESAASNDTEQWIDHEVVLHRERVQCEEELHY